MVNNSSSPHFSRAQEWADQVRGGQERYNLARLGVLLGMVAVAGVLFVTLPDSNDDVAAEPFVLSASADDVDGEAGAESGALGLGDEVTDTDDMAEGAGEGSSESTFDRDDLSAFAAAGADDAQNARFAQLATARLDVSRFSRKTTTSQAPATTEAPTTAAPTTAAPTTTTEASTAAAESTEATADDTTSTADESTDASEAADGTETTDGTDTADTADTTDTIDTTVADGDEAAATTAEETTTTAPPTTADNGFVDAGHGVMVPPILLEIRYCESRDNYTAANPYSSARGAYQFLTGSWAAYGHAARYGVSQAHLATPAQQDEAALLTWQRDGTRPWNASRHCWG